MTTASGVASRPALVRQSRRLNLLTLGYNSLEGVLSIGAGFLAGSIALMGFGIDSLIEFSASGAALWRLNADPDPARRQQAELVTHRVIGYCFLALAIYIAADAVQALLLRTAPRSSWIGMAVAAASLVVMPVLAHRKREVALALGSGALVAEARQTLFCTWLSAILLGGLALNAVLGWWWADPVAALAMVPFIVREGLEGVRAQAGDDDA